MDEPQRTYGKCQYAARTWSRRRRVIYKAEVACVDGREPCDNARFVVTNIPRVPKRVYENIYCQRAVIENHIKRPLCGLYLDRTSCPHFLANQLRCLRVRRGSLRIAAGEELRLKAKRTSLANAQVAISCERLLKLAAWIERSTWRIVLHLPDSAPWRQEWCQVARASRSNPDGITANPVCTSG